MHFTLKLLADHDKDLMKTVIGIRISYRIYKNYYTDAYRIRIDYDFPKQKGVAWFAADLDDPDAVWALERKRLRILEMFKTPNPPAPSAPPAAPRSAA